jgi:hypothetical protein
MSYQDIISEILKISSPPTAYFRSAFVNAVKCANPNVRATFFASEPVQYYNTRNSEQVFNEFSVKYASFVISTIPNFDFNRTVHNIDFKSIDQWLKSRGAAFGVNMFVDYLNRSKTFADCYADPAGTLKLLADHIATTEFFNGLVVESNTSGSSFPIIALLLFLHTLSPASAADYNRIIDAWKKHDQWSRFAGFESYDLLNTISNSFSQGSADFEAIKRGIYNACTASTVYNYSVTKSYPGQGGMSARAGSNYEEHHRKTTYGAAVNNWLNAADGPAKFGLKSGSGPNNETDQNLDGGGGCMIKGTAILMADGSTKPIEEIIEHDQVFGGGGIAICSSEMLVNDRMTGLYGINDDAPFMSFEHAVLTQRGWCSLSPDMSMSLNPHHTVFHLVPGDVVLKATGITNGEVTYEKVIVHTVPTQYYAPGKGPVGYVFHLRKGFPSYHANGYCCYAGYPQITTDYIAANMVSNMTPAEQLLFKQKIDEMSPLLEKAVGPSVLSAFSTMLKNPHLSAARANHTSHFGKHKPLFMNTETKIIPNLLLSAGQSDAPLPPGFEAMSLINGHLFINEELVNTQVEGDHIHWHRTNADGKDEVGSMRLSHQGLMGHGVVSVGGSKFSFEALASADYTLSYMDGNAKKSWDDFWMGFSKDPQGNSHTSGKLSIPGDAKKTADLNSVGNYTVLFSISKGTDGKSQSLLHVDVEFSSSYCAFGGSEWKAAEFDFTMDFRQLQGSIYKYDATKQAYRGQAYPLSGVCKNIAQLATMLERITKKQATAEPNLEPVALTQAPAAHSPLMASARALAGDIPLTVENLFTLPVPDMENVHKLSFAKLKNLMLYTIDEKWLQWFGETRPTIDGVTLTQADVTAAADATVKSFLVDKFAVGYLTQAFSKSTDGKIKDVFSKLDKVDDKLGYFWKGSDADTCFAKDKGYGLASAKLMDNAFTQSVPGLDQYLANKPVDWAASLYKHCTTEPTLSGLALQNTLDGRQRLTHLVSVMHSLDPVARVSRSDGKSVSYATALYEKVMDCRFNYVTSNSTTDNKTDLVEFLTEYFREYFNTLLAGGKWEENIRNEALADLEKLMKEQGVENVNALVSQMGGIIADAIDVMVNFKDLPIAARINKWASEHETASKIIGGGLTMAVYAFSMFQTIQAFMGWKDLKPQEKAQVIINMVDMSASMFKDIAVWQAAKALSSADTTTSDLMKASSTMEEAQKEISALEAADDLVPTLQPELEVLDTPSLARAGEVAAQDASAAGDLAEAGSRWISVSKVAEGFAKGMAILAMGAACVTTGFEIAADFASGQPASIKALDIISIVANGIGFLVEAGAGIFALAGGTVCSAIPVIGVICAVVGIIVSIVLMFIHREPPPTPEESFVKDHCGNFITGLSLPPAEWLAKQKKLEDHLNNPAPKTTLAMA